MQPNDGFRNDDAQLRELLGGWHAPQTPPSLERRVLASRQVWWRFLLRGHIRVPVPVACCLVALMVFAAWRSMRPEGASAPCSIAEQPSVCISAIPGAC